MSDWKSRAKAVDWRGRAKPVSAPADDGPDVSGLNDKPKGYGDSGAVASIAEGIANPTTAGGAAAQKWAQGASFGLSDELQGAMGAADEASTMMRQAVGLEDRPEVLADPVTGEAPPEKSALERVLAAYRKNRDAHRGELDTASKAQPAVSAGAELTGAIMSPSLPGMGVSKGARGIGLVRDMAKTGAVAGAAYGLGKSDADLTQGEVMDAGKDALGGAALGAGTGAVMGGTLAVAQPLIRRLAERRAIKALDPYAAEMDALARQSPRGEPDKKARELARRLLDLREGPRGDGGRVMRAGVTSEGLAKKLAAEADDTGMKLENTLGRIQDETGQRPISYLQIAERLETQADDALRNSQPELAAALRKEAQQVMATAEARAASGQALDLTLPEAEAIKRTAQGAVKPNDYSRIGSPGVESNKALQRAWKESVEESAEALAGPEERTGFEALKKRFGDLATMRDIANKGAIRDLRNNAISLGDQQLAQVGAAAGQSTPESLQQAAALALLNRMGRRRGASTMAVGLDKLAAGDPGEAALTGLMSLTPEEEQRQRFLRLLSSLKD